MTVGREPGWVELNCRAGGAMVMDVDREAEASEVYMPFYTVNLGMYVHTYIPRLASILS